MSLRLTLPSSLFTSLIVAILTVGTTSFAQTARKSATRSAVDKKPGSNTTQQTALRKIAITPLSVAKSLQAEVPPAKAMQLAQQIVAELNAKSFLTAVVFEGSGLSRPDRERLTTKMNEAALDGSVVGEIGKEGASLFIVSKSGIRIASMSVPMRMRLVNEQTLKALGTAIVDEIVRTVPYRGFLTKETEDGVFELNLGSRHGIAKNQKFRVFDFEEAHLGAAQIDRGEVQVLEVAEDTAVVEVTSNNHQIRPFQKIGFDQRARGMVQQSQTPTRGYALIGAELISITGSSDERFADRAYNMKSTPGFILGLGWNRTSFRAVLAQAVNDDADLVYTEFLGLYRFWEKRSGYTRFTAAGGVRYSRFNVTARKQVVSTLESSTSLSPVAEARLERVIGGPVQAFFGGSLFYPMLNSGNGADSTPIFAYGAGAELGASVDFSPRVTVVIGGKMNMIRRPMEGQNASSERYSQIFTDVIARF